MAEVRYRRSARCVYSLHYHLVRCPEFRRAVWVGRVADDLRKRQHAKARELAVTIEALDILPDHVHLVVAADPTDAPQRLANQFKGYTARRLQQKHPELRSRWLSLWSRSYYAGSVGHVSEETVTRYLAAQKGR